MPNFPLSLYELVVQLLRKKWFNYTNGNFFIFSCIALPYLLVVTSSMMCMEGLPLAASSVLYLSSLAVVLCINGPVLSKILVLICNIL
jgi:hypothetical protein